MIGIRATESSQSQSGHIAAEPSRKIPDSMASVVGDLQQVRKQHEELRPTHLVQLGRENIALLRRALQKHVSIRHFRLKVLRSLELF